MNGANVLFVFRSRVAVVHAQVADAAELERDPKVEADALGVANMQIAVGLWWESRRDTLMQALSEVGFDDLANEVPRLVGRVWVGWFVHGRPSRALIYAVED